eukprot:2453418-Prorocentrum_lima.AAC.1
MSNKSIWLSHTFALPRCTERPSVAHSRDTAANAVSRSSGGSKMYRSSTEAKQRVHGATQSL